MGQIWTVKLHENATMQSLKLHEIEQQIKDFGFTESQLKRLEDRVELLKTHILNEIYMIEELEKTITYMEEGWE